MANSTQHALRHSIAEQVVGIEVRLVLQIEFLQGLSVAHSADGSGGDVAQGMESAHAERRIDAG